MNCISQIAMRQQKHSHEENKSGKFPITQNYLPRKDNTK